ncbi:YceH family protein [Endozoicomonas sp.]|uniref:YceH family protein n=1 Tax=Endozoicomonas sp. TaxID=1892382 RepID=UPI003AF64155
MSLSLNETRVIGCLLEKESTTPDQYPLSLNALTNACNQKSNREPVLSLAESEVKETLEVLLKERLVSEDTGARVSKYRHRFCNTEFGSLQLTDQERGIVCVLFLRGAQTPGELRGRTGRLAEFADVREVEGVLQQMVERGLVVQLPREAGKRESRYAHLFSGKVSIVNQADLVADDKARIRELEHEVMILRAEVERLNRELGR